MAVSGTAPDESTITLEVRALTQTGALSSAVDLLTSAAIAPKLRTFAPVLRALLLDQQDLSGASALRVHMEAAGLELGEDEHVAFIATTAQQPPSADAAECDELTARMRELQRACTALRRTSVDTLHAAFESAHSRARGGSAALVAIDAAGVCSGCGVRLVSPPVAPAEREALGTALLEAAAALDDGVAADMHAFGEWLQTRSFNHVIDVSCARARHSTATHRPC
jgi:hypothetical protein